MTRHEEQFSHHVPLLGRALSKADARGPQAVPSFPMLKRNLDFHVHYMAYICGPSGSILRASSAQHCQAQVTPKTA